jgi:hypothetical protein
MLGILECHTGMRSVVRMGVMRGIMRAVGAIMRSPNMHRRFKLAANVQTAVELSSLTGTKSVTLGTYWRGRTILPLQKCVVAGAAARNLI